MLKPLILYIKQMDYLVNDSFFYIYTAIATVQQPLILNA